MRLWTIQPEEVYNIVINNGVFRCDPNHNDVEHFFKNSYEWLVKEMEKRIGKKPDNIIFPIWAWHTRYGKHKKPDLRQTGYGLKGKEYILIEIEVPDNQVVLTDYDAWHYVLNDWYLGASTCEEEYDKESEWLDSLDHNTIEIEKKKSWQRIFDISPFQNNWVSRGQFIQATFWELKKEYIINARKFTAR